MGSLVHFQNFRHGKKCFFPDEIEDLISQGYTDEQIKSFTHFERIELSLEDWQTPEKPMGAFELGGWGIAICQAEQKFHALQKSEYEKIEQRKTEIVEGFVVTYTEALISWFESRYMKSKEKELLIRNELEKLDKLLFQWKERFVYSTFGDGLWLRFDTTGYKKWGTMCDWYERFCINGEDAKKAVSRRHSRQTAKELNNLQSDHLHYVVAALAFERFKKYLNVKLGEQEPPGSGETLLNNKRKPNIKANYCCRFTLQKMQTLVNRYNVTQDDVRHFETFFNMHPYTNLDLGNVYRDKTTEDLDFEKLISKIFEVASLFEGDVQDYFFTCVEEDAERENKHRIGETDWYILQKKILERRKLERNVSPAIPKAKEGKHKDLPLFEEAIKDPNKLPELWKLLSEMEVPFVSETGKYIWEGRPHAILLAFAQALRSRDKLREGISAEATYLILCTRFEVKPSPSIRQIRRGKRDYKEHLEAFNDVLRGD